ncbi:TPA: nitroreductase family protein [Candidatus Galligastranaerophilus gallistercoris]|nr:nitroreductase family protein [Candidatus Galligastranaerophilus gallistercoris]
MEFSEVVKHRHSVRKYRKGALINRDDVIKILTAAMHAPSSNNSRPWEFVVVENKEIIEKLKNLHPYASMLETASLAIVVCAIPQFDDLSKGYWQQDCGAAIENLLLEAANLNFGTCWCGIYPSLNKTEEFQKILDVKSIPLALIALGIPEGEEPETKGFYDENKVKFI